MPLDTLSARKRRQYIASSSWPETWQNQLGNVLGGPPPVVTIPPGLDGALRLFDFDSPLIFAQFNRKRRPHEGFLHATDLNLLGQDTFYGDPGQAQTFGQSQPYFARPPLHVQGWQWVAPLSLLGADQFYGADGQTPIFAVSQPVLVRRPLTQDFTAGNLLSTLLEVAAETIPPGLNGVLLYLPNPLISVRWSLQALQNANVLNLLLVAPAPTGPPAGSLALLGVGI